MAVYINPDGTPWFSGTGSLHLLRVQVYAALWVICFTAIATFIILKLVGLVIPLRMSDKEHRGGRHRRSTGTRCTRRTSRRSATRAAGSSRPPHPRPQEPTVG